MAYGVVCYARMLRSGYGRRDGTSPWASVALHICGETRWLWWLNIVVVLVSCGGCGGVLWWLWWCHAVVVVTLLGSCGSAIR